MVSFRAKELDSENWVIGDLIHYDKDEYYILEQFNRSWDILYDGIRIDINTVGRSTSFLDKNNKTIFTNSFVLYENNILSIVEDEGCICLSNGLKLTEKIAKKLEVVENG